MTDSAERICHVCYMPPEDEGAPMVVCCAPCDGEGGGHHMCAECATNYLESSIASVTQAMLRQWKEGPRTLPCPHSAPASSSSGPAGGCFLAPKALFALRDPSVSALMSDLSASLSSTLAQQEVMTRMITKGGGDDGSDEPSASAAEEEKHRLIAHIKGRIDDVCTACISCPHCGAPFMDFSGCLALTCGSCSKEFCGVCLSIRHVESNATIASTAAAAAQLVPVRDAHAQVLVCLKKYDPAFLAAYGMRHGDYFISNAGGHNWERWKDRIKAAKVLAYLFTIKKDVLWRVYDQVEQHITANSLLNGGEVEQLKQKVFSHEANAQHLIRIPVLFSLLYASKMDCSFGSALAEAERLMTQPVKIALGRDCVARMREVYPSWKPVRVRVPGEDFEAINYPPEALSLITATIDEWGVRAGLWSGVSTAAAPSQRAYGRGGGGDQPVRGQGPAPAVAAAAPAEPVRAVAAPNNNPQPQANNNEGPAVAWGRGRGRGGAGRGIRGRGGN